MHALSVRRISWLAAFLICAIAAVAWVVMASTAGASATFDPQLTSVAPSAPSVLTNAAPYTLASTATKKPTRLAVKSAKRIARVPGTTTVRTASRARVAVSTTSELTRARRLLAAQIRLHPILRGTTVTFGDAHGYQAIAYYQSGRIVISKSHRASLDAIIRHEVWHVIDWRDNHRMDWGERVPR